LLPLDETSLPSVASISKFAPHRADLEFHEEWLRDEPCEATTTGSGSSIPVARCQLSPGNCGEHEIRGADFFLHLVTSFSYFRGKRFVVFRTPFPGLVAGYSQREWLMIAYELRCRECGKT